MHRITSADSLFHDGNPATGVQGTVVDAAWLNVVQEELAGLVEWAGLTPSAVDNTQLLQALQAEFAPKNMDFGVLP